MGDEVNRDRGRGAPRLRTEMGPPQVNDELVEGQKEQAGSKRTIEMDGQCGEGWTVIMGSRTRQVSKGWG